MGESIVKTVCGLCAPGICGMLVHVVDGKMVKVEGDPECPFNRGALCPQGLAAVELVYHPDRLKYPMRRAGKRGEGTWERISWDEALDTIAERLSEVKEKYGPLAVAIGSGTGRPEPTHSMRRFMQVWGTPNRIGYPHNCLTPRRIASLLQYGEKFIIPDVDNTDCIVFWGSNITHTGLCRGGADFAHALRRGVKTICIDPYNTPLASKADIWLQVRPHSDCALALAWMNVIISENLYDRDFVEKWTNGFDRLAEHVKEFTPEWAEPITWVPADKIRQAARMFATSKPSSIFIGVAVQFGMNTTHTLRAIFSLPALVGNIDVAGGQVFSNIPKEATSAFGEWIDTSVDSDLWKQSVGAKFPLLIFGGNRISSHTGWRAVLESDPYPIRAVLVEGGNPLLSHENSRGFVYKAIMSLDFILVMDQFMTPTAELADIVLPATTPFERDEIHGPSFSSFPRYINAASPKVIEPLWECRNDADVFADILKRFGLDYGGSTYREYIDNVLLKPRGIDFEELKKRGWERVPDVWRKYEKGLLRSDGKPGFNTHSGKIELYSDYLLSLGIEPLPVHKEPVESPYGDQELAKEYPLVLSTGIRSRLYYHSQYRQLDTFREIHPWPLVRINPATAASLDIMDGDWVYIETPRGRIKQKAMLTLGIDSRVVLAEHDWWFPEKPAPEHGVWDSNVNVLISEGPPYDPGIGSTPARSLLCKVYKAEGGVE
jgi:anaerobic selenocysteine-containing dehydrogenase